MRRYVSRFLFLFLGGTALVVAFNWLVNPFDLFAGTALEGFNAEKPALRDRQRLAFAYALRHQQPEFLILGNSRATHIKSFPAAWQDKRVFNLAVSSSSVYEQQRYFQHALAVSKVEGALYGIDYISFHTRTQQGFDEARLAVAPDGTARGFDLVTYGRDAVPSLLSLDALNSSIDTVRRQPRAGEAVALDGDQAKRIRANGGHRALFTELERNAATTPCAETASAASYDAYRIILRAAYDAQIDMRLFISPEHARLQETWRRLGRDSGIAAWKEEVVRINEEEAARAHRAPFPLWDFDDYSTITTEAVPADGDDTTLMQWYWEGSHYTSRTAQQIVARIYGTGTDIFPAGFGTLLDSRNLASHLAAVEQRRATYLQTHPADIAELDAIIAKARMRFSPR